MFRADETLLLGWPIHSTSPAARAQVHPLMTKRGQQDLASSLTYDGDGHCMTFAPTGSGKGVAAIIPNLLHYSGPIIVVDPKGENFVVTARFRSTYLRQHIILLDPFHAVDDAILSKHGLLRSSLNPLSVVNVIGADIQNTAQMLADLFSQGGTTKEDFWNISAKFLGAGLFAHEMERAAAQPRAPSFFNIVRQVFAEDVNSAFYDLLSTQAPGAFVRSAVAGFQAKAASEQSGILSTLQTFLTTMMSDDLKPHIDTTSFDLRAIVDGDPCTVYIVIPPSKLDSHAFLLRAWISTFLHAVMERKTTPKARTLFMLDECANLGRLNPLRKAITLLRGYGLQVWMFFQDMDQLSFLYEDPFTFINNCGVVQAFGMTRMAAAKAISGAIGGYSPKELMRLDRSQQIVSLSSGVLRACRLIKYFRDPAFGGLFDPNPRIGLHNATATRHLMTERAHCRKYH
jgi:type IV secretion system protein VirD4